MLHGPLLSLSLSLHPKPASRLRFLMVTAAMAAVAVATKQGAAQREHVAWPVITLHPLLPCLAILLFQKVA